MGRGGESKTLILTTAPSKADYGGVAPLGSAKGFSTQRKDDCHELLDVSSSSSSTSSCTESSERVWPSLVVAVCLGLVSGSLYGFGRYAKDLRYALRISQTTVQKFGILLDTGNYIGHPLTGWIYDKFGPQVSCWSAALIVFLSYSTIQFGLSSSGPIWMMDMGFLGVGFGSGLGYIAALGSTTALFTGTPHQGRAVGFVAAGYGFSSTLVGITYHHVGIENFFWLWAVLVAVMNIIGSTVFRSKQVIPVTVDNEGDLEESTVSPSTSLLHESPIKGTEKEAVEWTSWKKFDFWLLFGSFACITGCGLMVINNISTMVESIGGDDSLSDYLVVGLSLCNVLGRILMGSLADHPNLNKLDLYRYSSLLMAFALMTSVFGGTSSICLAVTVALAAISYGGSWVLIIGVLAEFYGKRDFGKDYGLIAMGPALSGMAFNAFSAQIYESHANQDSGVCIGSSCYRDAFLMTMISATTGYLILLWFFPTKTTSSDWEGEDETVRSDVISDTCSDESSGVSCHSERPSDPHFEVFLSLGDSPSYHPHQLYFRSEPQDEDCLFHSSCS